MRSIKKIEELMANIKEDFKKIPLAMRSKDEKIEYINKQIPLMNEIVKEHAREITFKERMKLNASILVLEIGKKTVK
jgi:t-SNARE complex subunit (syntaxin)